MKTVCFALLVSCAPAAAVAADFPLALDKDKPVASITIPDDWKPKVGDHGVEGTSPDGTAFIVAKVLKADEKTVGDYSDDTTGYIEEQGVTFPELKADAEPKTTDTDTKIGDLDTAVSRLDEATTFKGAPTTITSYSVLFAEKQALIVTTRGPKDDKVLASIVATLKPVK